MKHAIILYLIGIMSSLSSQQLKVTIGSSESGNAYLFNTVTQKMDTIAYSKHSFSIARQIDEPELYHLYFQEINNWAKPIYLILSKELTGIYLDSLQISTKQKEWNRYYPIRPKFIQDPNRNESLYRVLLAWSSFSDSIQNHYNDNGDDNAESKKIREKLYSDFISNCRLIISENNDKLVSAYILDQLRIYNLLTLGKIQEYFSLLDEKIQQSVYGKRIANEAGLEIYSRAPNFEVTDIQGNKYSLEKLKGQKILLHFWSTTCAPCIKEIPKLKALTESNKNLLVLNLSCDNDYDRLQKGITKLGIAGLIIIFDKNGFKSPIVQDYYIRGIPANYLINEQGEIIAKKESLAEIIEILK